MEEKKSMNEKQWMEKLEAEGYGNLFTCPNGPHTEFPEHTHPNATVHVVLHGDITMVDTDGTQTMVKEGERFDMPAGTTHSVTCGEHGCTFVVGDK